MKTAKAAAIGGMAILVAVVLVYLKPAKKESFEVKTSTDQVQPKSSINMSASSVEDMPIASVSARDQKDSSDSIANNANILPPPETIKRQNFANKMDANIQSQLSDAGFSQNEIDVCAKAMAEEVARGNEAIDVGGIIDLTAKQLGLDKDKKKALESGVMKALGLSTQITYDQWDQCMRYRARQLSSCADGYADEASRIIAEVSNQGLNGQDWNKAREVIQPLIEEVSSKCGVIRESAASAFDIFLGNCP